MSETLSDELLREGIESYPQALIAIGEFIRVIQDMWREVILTMRPQIEASLKTQLRSNEMKVDPKELSNWRGQSPPYIGVLFKEKAGVWREQWYYIEWNEKTTKESRIGIIAWITLSSEEAAIAVQSSLKQTSGSTAIERQGPSIFISRKLSPSESGQLRTRMEELVNEWCELWKCVGGVTKFV